MSVVFDDEAGIDRNELLEELEASPGRSGVGPPFSHMAAAALTLVGDLLGVSGRLTGEAGDTSISSNDSSSSSSSCAALMAISVGDEGRVMVYV